MNVEILQGDITKIESDVIVNATDAECSGRGGVDEAIHVKAGYNLKEECRKNLGYDGPLQTGKIMVTKGYNLPCNHVIHTRGPVFEKEDPLLLLDCYINSIKKADELEQTSIAFPAISTGAFGFPIKKNAELVKKVMKNLKEPKHIKKISFILVTKEHKETYETVFSSN